MLAESSKGSSAFIQVHREHDVNENLDPSDLTLVEGYRRRRHQLPSSEIVLETKICHEWKLGRCNKGEKCRFRHKTSTEEKYNHIFLDESGVTAPSRNLKEEANDYTIRMKDPWLENNIHGGSNNKMARESRDEDSDKREGEKDSQNEALLFLGASIMTLFTLEKIRQLVFKGDTEGDERKGNDEKEMAKVNEKFEDLGRRSRERCLSAHETLEGNGLSGEIQGDQEPDQPISTVSQYIVLESNLVACGPGLEISKITPGYDLCQVSFQLPIETTGREIEEMLSEEGLDGSDFHILRTEEREGGLEVTILTNIRFGNSLESKGKAFCDHFEVRRDAIWIPGTMKPGKKPSIMLTWDAESLSEEISVALAEVYDRLLELEGARSESCCLLSTDSESTENQVTLTVEFDNWENALEAAGDIQSKRPTGIPSFQVQIPNPHQQSIVIPLLQYEAQKRQWVELSDTDPSESGQIEIEVVDDSDEVIIRAQGENKALVGALKVRIENLARGEVLEGAYWHPSFGSSEESASFFSDVMESATVYLQCRSEENTLVLYGEPDRIEKVRGIIQEEVNRREKVMTKTALTGRSIGFFEKEGIQKLKDLVGEENADLKTTPRWSAIMMRGGETATHYLRQLIKDSLVKEPTAFQETRNCPVCLEEQLCPEMLECGHGYCSGCLNLFLKAAADNKKFPIRCVGEGATCNVPIALPFIGRFLPYYTFKQMVEVAFAAYLEQNPAEFRYCKTPDCRQTYGRQSADEATIITCPSCFAKTCSSCSESHEDMSCEEYRVYRDPEEQDRLNNELAGTSGYKRCPRCAVWVEKTGGCNHMNCRCGVHSCWTCLGIFEPDLVYQHVTNCVARV